ncbi:MAG: U32 family peptidase [Deltaproteobacteria bacterium]|nr:U32 family peptidase [Deltaproteobacteria bacterium]
MQTSKPELLAPAGNLEAFFAALEAGADAIYVGGREFSARQRAKNFSHYELARMVPYAHRRRVRVLAAVNTLLKESEIRHLYKFVGFLEEIGIDALIVQDPGVLHLLRRDFPSLTVHASTQLSIHNAAGVRQAARLGVRRVVLARELSLAEIAAIRRETEVELEVFVFGALCLSVAGLCQFSSFLGGQAGNRGRCTQPCRRLYRQGRQSGYFLSPADFSALEFLPRLQQLGIDSFKIEGRLKSSHYVATVVGVFRRAIDAVAATGTLKEELQAELQAALREAYARRPGSANLSGSYAADLFAPGEAASMGRFVGKVRRMRAGTARVKVVGEVVAGDRLKVIAAGRDGRENSFTVRRLAVVGDKTKRLVDLQLPRGLACRPGDLLYKVGAKDAYSERGAAHWLRELEAAGGRPAPSGRRPPVKPCRPADFFPAGQPLSPAWPARRWWVKVASWENLQLFARDRSLGLVVELNRRLLHRLAGQERRLFQRRPDLAWWLPPLQFPGREARLRETVKRLAAVGFRTFFLDNLGHAELFSGLEGEFQLATGTHLPASNLAALAAYAELGVSAVTLSPEMDRDSLAALLAARPAAAPAPLVLAFAFPQLLPTRMPLPVAGRKAPLVSSRGEEFLPLVRDGITYLVAIRPYDIIAELEQLPGDRQPAWLIDLSFYPPGIKPGILLARLRRHKSLANSSTYNFTRKWA